MYHHCLSLWYLFLFHFNCKACNLACYTKCSVHTQKNILHPHIHETIILSKKQLKYLKIKGLFIQIIKVKSAFWANIFECGWLIWWLVRSIPPSFSSPSNSHFLTFKYLKMIVWIVSSFHFSSPPKNLHYWDVKEMCLLRVFVPQGELHVGFLVVFSGRD